MSEVHVVDMGAVTALGMGVDALWTGLLAGRTGVGPVRRFSTEHYASHVAACIASLDEARPGTRLDALLEMLFDARPPVPADSALLTATTKAGIDQLESAVRQGEPSSGEPPSPKGGSQEASNAPGPLPAASRPANRLDRILGYQVANRVADRLGLQGPRHNVIAACASSTIALALAASRIACDEADSILVCGLDLLSEFVFSGFSALGALSASACRPFDQERDGLLLGEGAAYVLLMSDNRRRREKRRSFGRIAGWGIASDAHHITAPSRTGEGLIQAVRQALARAGLTPADVAAVSAHGTGSVYNDAMELTAFAALFDPLPPLHSVKGATGHTMGACGAIETIVARCSLEQQCLPPTVGLRTPEPAARARVSGQAQPISGTTVLTTNSGFGGINACLLLQRSDAS